MAPRVGVAQGTPGRFGNLNLIYVIPFCVLRL
jgi:hypothetical protein